MAMNFNKEPLQRWSKRALGGGKQKPAIPTRVWWFCSRLSFHSPQKDAERPGDRGSELVVWSWGLISPLLCQLVQHPVHSNHGLVFGFPFTAPQKSSWFSWFCSISCRSTTRGPCSGGAPLEEKVIQSPAAAAASISKRSRRYRRPPGPSSWLAVWVPGPMSCQGRSNEIMK